jgi:hypothetical protein
VYHNLKSFQHCEYYNELWTNPTQFFANNEKDIYIRLDLNEDSFAKWKEANKIEPSRTLADLVAGKRPEPLEEAKRWPGEVDPIPPNPDQLLLAFAPFPTKKPYPVIPRYFTRF